MEERDLPVGWETYCLDELGGTKGGKTPSKSRPEFWEPGTINWTSPKDMKVFDLNGAEDQISDLAITEGGMEVLPAGSVLMVTRSGILSHTFPVAVANSETSINQDIKAVRPVAGLDERFLAYSLKSLGRVVLQACSKEGTTVASVETKLLERLPLPLAPLNEQRRIAAKLDTTLAAVEACRQRLDGVAAILKRFRQAVLAAATSGELTREWREERGIEMDTWKGFEFSDLVNESRTGLVRSAAEQHELQDGLVPYLKMDSIGESWGCNHEGLKAVRCEGAEKGIYELAYGDWLFNTRNSLELVGKSCVWEGPAGVVFNNNILRVRFASKMRPQWVEIYFRSPGGRDMLAGVKSATTSVAAIYQRSLMALEIQVPSLEEQSELIDRVETLFTLADQLEARLTTTRQVVDRLTPALLAKAFRGELVPQDPGDEPASVLLERIRAARQAEAGAGKPSRRGRKKAATNPDQIAMEAAPVSADFLAGLLRECGPLSERALLAVSELEPQRFQQQLYRELESGTAREVQDNGQVLLEAVG